MFYVILTACLNAIELELTRIEAASTTYHNERSPYEITLRDAKIIIKRLMQMN